MAHTLYDRTALFLNDNNAEQSSKPTDIRLIALQKDNHLSDNKLTELYWNFAKYLMISGSREGTLPLTLQGIWNKDMLPPWGSKYTININTEMNYWGVETLRLGECHTPLFDLIERMRPNVRETARDMYGCKGFTAHRNTDLWGDTSPHDLWSPATQWPMGAAWLCLHIWEHYSFTRDKIFLTEKFDTLKEAAEFFEDFLIENAQGELVTCPSVSPENTYVTDSGEKGCICMGPTMDSQIIRELFTAVIKASEILNIDSDYAEKLSVLCSRLPANKVGKFGQVMEWAVDYDEDEPGHRHISQLFGLYPADQISIYNTPVLAEAARATINRRLSFGGGHTGWSRAWIINFWARLLDSQNVYENIQLLLSHSTNLNMFDNHPPFQIDGNFGGAAGITEAIVQSHYGKIRFLPALPKAWKTGYLKGIGARGGFTIDIFWDNNMLSSARITSLYDTTCVIYSEVPITVECAVECSEVKTENNCYCFNTYAGKTYTIKPTTLLP